MNVNGQAVAQAKLDALIEAAERVLADSDAAYQQVRDGSRPYNEVQPWAWLSLRQLASAIAEARKGAALAAPVPEGDAEDALRKATDIIAVVGNAPTWNEAGAAAHALASAGLLARPVDREAAVQRGLDAASRVKSSGYLGGNTEEKVRVGIEAALDAIIREVGR